MPDHRPDVYFEGGIMVLRASSLGGCIGALTRTGLGMTPAPPPADLERRWAEGVTAEPYILNSMRVSGWKPMDKFSYPQVAWTDDDQPEVELWVGDKIVVRCHPDAVAQCYLTTADTPWAATKDRRVVEAKALRPSFPRDFPPYLWQISVEMHGTGLPGLWAYGAKNEQGVVEGAIELVPVDVAPYSLIDIKKRALVIYKAVMSRAMPACDVKQWPCGFYMDADALCNRDNKMEAEAFPEDVVEEATSLAGEFRARKAILATYQSDLDEVKAKLKKLVADLPGDRYGADGVVLSRVTKLGNVDWKAAEKDGVEINKYRGKKTSYWEVRDAAS